jgi:DNA-binding response OmpR family regulator
MRLILAEDDALFGQAVQKSLTREGFAVDWVQSGQEFFAASSCHSYDFAILDLCLPDSSGEEILQRVRSKLPQLPVIVISSCSQAGRRVHLLDLGADDFLVKPMDLDELTARIRCVLRRLPEDRFDVASSECGGLRLFAQRCCASLHERSVTLTHREFWLLEVLVRKKNKIVSRSEIEDALYGWGEEVESNAVEVYVHHLRRKLSPDLIHTIRGVGYQLAPLLDHARPAAG